MPLDRFVNAVYAWAVAHMDDKRRKDFDAALNRSVTREVRRRDPDAPPPWWKSDEDATRSSLALARQLGLRIPELGT